MKRQIYTTLIFSFLLAFSLFVFLSFMPAPAVAQNIPTLTPYVNDFANVIDASHESQINNYATQLESATTAEIAVLTVDSTQPMTIEEYAVLVFEKNGIGQQGKDNGILIIAAIEDRKWRIEVGYGLEGTINDAKAGRIGREYMTTYFREGNYGEGLYLTVKTLGDIISGNETLSSQFDDSSDYDTEVWIVFLVIFLVLIFVLVPIMLIIKQYRCPKCKSWMRTEQKGDKVCYVCKKCGYRKCVKKKGRTYFFFYAGGRGWGGGGSGGGGFGGGSSGGGGASGGW